MKEKIDPLKRKRSAGFSILAALLLIGSGGRAQQLANQAAPENMSTADGSLRSGLLLQNYSDLYPVLNGVRTGDNMIESNRTEERRGGKEVVRMSRTGVTPE